MPAPPQPPEPFGYTDGWRGRLYRIIFEHDSPGVGLVHLAQGLEHQREAGDPGGVDQRAGHLLGQGAELLRCRAVVVGRRRRRGDGRQEDH